MKILVPIKRVADPDNANKVKVSDDGKQVTSEGLEWKLNPFDEWSLETALRLTEDAGAKKRVGEVVLVTIGPKDAVTTMRQGLAMGAERGILIEAEDGQLDSHTVAAALAKVVEKESPDVVFLGKQAADSDSNVAGTVLAEMLDWPLVNYATNICTDDEGKTFDVKRELDVGVQTLKVTSPCVFTSSDRILQPQAVKNGVTAADFAYPESDGGRYAKLKDIMMAKKKPVEETTLSDLGVEPAGTDEYVEFALPSGRTGSVVFVEDVAELVEKLKTEAKVL